MTSYVNFDPRAIGSRVPHVSPEHSRRLGGATFTAEEQRRGESVAPLKSATVQPITSAPFGWDSVDTSNEDTFAPPAPWERQNNGE